MQVLIDPADNILYKSFYVKALYDAFGKRNVRFSSAPFRKLSLKSRLSCCMCFVVIDHEVKRKYCISLNDPYHVIEELYAWCDVYGSVNANFEHYPQLKYPKLVALCPSFGIRCFDKQEAVWMALCNFLKAPSCVLRQQRYNKHTEQYDVNAYHNLKHHFGKYLKGYTTRCEYNDYTTTEESLHDYVFFLSTLWYNDEWNKNDEGVNLSRAHFIRAMRRFPSLRFEGGLVGEASREGFQDVITQQRTTMAEWMTKTKQSAFVFNTPAFWNCHGWKLGEYLALGKCIISTPLSNDLPAPLVHGEHLHLVDNNEESIANAIAYIMAHPDYRRKLEEGARDYWQRYGTPAASLQILDPQLANQYNN